MQNTLAVQKRRGGLSGPGFESVAKEEMSLKKFPSVDNRDLGSLKASLQKKITEVEEACWHLFSFA